MKNELEKPLKLQNYFVQQIQLEQDFLLLSKIQRTILKILLSADGPMNEYELRIEVYHQLVKPELFKAQNSLELSFIYEINDIFMEEKEDPINFESEANREEEYGTSFVKLLEERFQKPLKNFEIYLRAIAKRLKVDIPSNVFFTKELKDLIKDKFVKRNPKTQRRRTVYSIDPDFHANWTKTRMSIMDAIKKGTVSSDYFTETSCSFWQID